MLETDAQPSVRRDSIAIEGSMRRSDRVLFVTIIGGLLGLMVLTHGWRSQIGVICIVAIVLGMSWHFLTRGRWRREPIGLTFTKTGITMHRHGTDADAPWKFFELATIESQARRPRMGATHRLTLHNRFKPSIASFIHPRASNEVIFHALIVVDFFAEESTIQHLHAMLEECIREPVRRPPPRPHAHAVDPTRLLRLHACMRCDYLFEGLVDSANCPECGWAFERESFLMDGILRRSTAATSVISVLAVIIAASFTCAVIVQVAAVLPILIVLVMGAFLVVLCAGRHQLIITHAGIQVWRRRSTIGFHPWSHIGELRTTRQAFGQWRIVATSDDVGRAERGEPSNMMLRRSTLLLDFTIDGNSEEGRVLCEETQRRWRAATRNDPHQ